MPTDPKFRTVARHSKQPVTLVLAVYVHMLVHASQADPRGTLFRWCDEDVSIALDVGEEQVSAVREAMQGRLLEGDTLMGWERRQPDSGGAGARGGKTSTERSRAHRAKLKREKEGAGTPACNGMQRDATDATECNAPDKDTDKSNTPTSLRSVGERAHATSEGVTVPADLQPDRSTAANLKTLNVDPGFELAKFIAHHEAQGTTLADGKAWQAKLRKWLLDAHQFNADRNRVTDARVQAAQSHSQTRQDAITAAADALGVGSQYLQHHTQGATYAIEN